LFKGEVVIAEAQHVLLFAPVSEHKQGKSGSLSVTNFKLTFVTAEERPREVSKCIELIIIIFTYLLK
jgi:myotubularin-related protein 10/11/12